MHAYLIDFKDGVPDLTFPVPETGCVVGRDAGCLIQIADPRVSRMHVRIAWEGECWCVEDLKTRNGTRVNDMPISKGTIKDGDRLIIGSKVLLFSTRDPNQTNFIPGHVIDFSTKAEGLTLDGQLRKPAQ